MLSTITILTSILFAAVYPLCFWISAKDPLKEFFHRFHIGLPNVIAGILTVFILLSNYPYEIKLGFGLWFVVFSAITAFFWSKETLRLTPVTVISLMGFILFIKMHFFLLNNSPIHIYSWLIGSVIFCSSLYAMNLGHWYLNVHGLQIKHLRKANYVFWIAIFVRFISSLLIILTQTTVIAGETLPLYQFIWSMEGCFLLIGIFFGILFPLFGLYFSHETIKLKNTQSTTGILYVILCGILIGDITFKYYAIHYGIAL